MVVVANHDLVCRNLFHHAGVLCQNADAGIACRFVFHTGSDNRRFRHQKRNRLALHVRTHQRTVCVIVLQEGNHRSRDRHHLTRRNIHIIHTLRRYLQKFILISGYDLFVDKTAVRVQRLGSLCDIIPFFGICRHVFHFFGDDAGLFIHSAVRSFDKSVLIHLCKAAQRVDQSDVRTLRRLDWAHTSVVRMVHVTHLTRQTAWAEG